MGPRPARLATLNSVVMATETSWQLECISFENKTSTQHYASTRTASLLLMDINIYTVWKIFSRWRRASGLWRALSDICVGVPMCGGASALLSAILYKNNDAGFYNMQIKHSLCLTYIWISSVVLRIWTVNLCCRAVVMKRSQYSLTAVSKEKKKQQLVNWFGNLYNKILTRYRIQTLCCFFCFISG